MKNIDQLKVHKNKDKNLLSWVLFSFQSANKPAPHNVFLGCLWCDITDLLVKSGLLAPSDFFLKTKARQILRSEVVQVWKNWTRRAWLVKWNFDQANMTWHILQKWQYYQTQSGLKLVSEFFFLETELVASTRVLYKGCVAPSSGVKWNGREVDVSVL